MTNLVCATWDSNPSFALQNYIKHGHTTEPIATTANN